MRVPQAKFLQSLISAGLFKLIYKKELRLKTKAASFFAGILKKFAISLNKKNLPTDFTSGEKIFRRVDVEKKTFGIRQIREFIKFDESRVYPP